MSEKVILRTARFLESEARAMDDWRRMQPTIPAISDTIRVLVMRGLESQPVKEEGASK